MENIITLEEFDILAITPFDPAIKTAIHFIYHGPQILKTYAYVEDVDDPALCAYDDQAGSIKSHLVPSGKIELYPGRKYQIKIKVSGDGFETDYTEPEYFTCYSKPIFEFAAIENIQADLRVKLKFATNEKARQDLEANSSHPIPPALYEPILQDFTFTLYDQNKNEIHTSGPLYHVEDLTYVFQGLENNEVYYLQATGTTTDGMRLDTADHKDPSKPYDDGLVEAYVQYQKIPANILMTLDNDPEHGSITLKSNIISIDYDTLNNNYELKDGTLILGDNELTYHTGFVIPKDMSIVLKAKKLPLGTFFISKSEYGQLQMALVHSSQQYYCKLIVANGDQQYVLYQNLTRASVSNTANQVIASETDKEMTMIDLDYNRQKTLIFTIHRKNNIYSLMLNYEEE